MALSIQARALCVQSEAAQNEPLRATSPQPSSVTPLARPHQHKDMAFSMTAAASHGTAIGSATAASAAFMAKRNSSKTPKEVSSVPSTETQDKVHQSEMALNLEKALSGPSALPAVDSEHPSLKHPKGAVKVIATDVDGTLLDSRQEMSHRTETALKLAKEQGVQVVLATGKARGPWFPEIKERLQLSCPAVFMQGLIVYSADGTIVYERTLEEDVAREVADVAATTGITLVAYCGERILCSEKNFHTDRLIGYGEPVPEAVGPLSEVVGSTPVHKLLFMGDDSTLALLRIELECQLAGRATLVTALHGMLEVLPLGASKAVGLRRVLGMLGVHEAEVLAAGDGENDIEMLRMAGFAVAMGNAGPQLKSEADFVSQTNDQDGLAHAVERFVLHPGFWCWD